MEQVGNPPIRYFEVPKTYDFNTERNELEGGAWQPVNRDTIEGISALAYFFSRSIQETYDVPVGIILSALGGSPAEARSEEHTSEIQSRGQLVGRLLLGEEEKIR